MKTFKGRVGLIQRVLPSYRAPFFDLLATRCEHGLSVFAGQARPHEAIISTSRLEVANYAPARNLHLFEGGLYLCWQRGLLPWLEDWDPDALIVEANLRYLSSSLAMRWMKDRGRPVIGWGLGSRNSKGLFSAWRRRFMHQFDAIIAYSQRGAMQYHALGLPSERIFVAPNAMTQRPKGVAPKSRRKGDRPRVLFVGRLQERKGVDVLLDACAMLPEALQPLVEIVGDGPARAYLEHLAAKIYPNAEFLGARFGPELEEIYAQADLFVLPGTGGLAIQEAMAHALPVIVAQGDGTQEDLVTEKNGWLVPPKNEESLARTLGEALSNIPRLREMGAESFQLVKESYNLETMTEVFVKALNEVGA